MELKEEMPDNDRRMIILCESRDNMKQQLITAKTNLIKAEIDIKNIWSLLCGQHDDIAVLERKGVKQPEKAKEEDKPKEVN